MAINKSIRSQHSLSRDTSAESCDLHKTCASLIGRTSMGSKSFTIKECRGIGQRPDEVAVESYAREYPSVPRDLRQQTIHIALCLWIRPPGDDIALLVSHRNNGIIECGMNMRLPVRYILPGFFWPATTRAGSPGRCSSSRTSHSFRILLNSQRRRVARAA